MSREFILTVTRSNTPLLVNCSFKLEWVNFDGETGKCSLVCKSLYRSRVIQFNIIRANSPWLANLCIKIPWVYFICGVGELVLLVNLCIEIAWSFWLWIGWAWFCFKLHIKMPNEIMSITNRLNSLRFLNLCFKVHFVRVHIDNKLSELGLAHNPLYLSHISSIW